MTSDELREAFRETARLLGMATRDVKRGDLGICLAKLTAAVEDDDLEVPAELFAELPPTGRKMALGGMVLLLGQAMG